MDKIHWRIRVDTNLGYLLNKVTFGVFSNQIKKWYDNKYPTSCAWCEGTGIGMSYPDEECSQCNGKGYIINHKEKKEMSVKHITIIIIGYIYYGVFTVVVCPISLVFHIQMRRLFRMTCNDRAQRRQERKIQDIKDFLHDIKEHGFRKSIEG